MTQNARQVTLEDLMRKRYLFEGTEVQLTGRIAKKPSRSKEIVLFEIRSTNANDTWKRWVRLADMYEISHPLSHRVEFAADLVDAVRRVKENEKKGE